MIEPTRPALSDEYATIVEHVPIVSVDLLVHHDGGLVLGKRQSAPAKGEQLIPDGSVLKGETRRQAAHRVAEEELGSAVLVDDKLGVYDHVYHSVGVKGVDSKQYPDDQHADLAVFDAPFPDRHDYVERYVRDLRREGYTY